MSKADLNPGRWSLLALTLALAPRPSEAYCITPSFASDWLAEYFPEMRIPVYISSGANSSLENTGVTFDELERILIDAIARHNETVVSPKLYFAGYNPEPLTPVTPFGVGTNPGWDWDPGITVYSYDCNLLSQTAIPRDYLCNAHDPMNIAQACGTRRLNKNGDPVGFVSLVSANCNLASPTVTWTMDGSTTEDLAFTFNHEIGHTLGLQHTNMTPTECLNIAAQPGNTNIPPGEENTGVMRTTRGASLSRFRHWRRDDLDAFDDLYETFYPEYDLAYWSDDMFPNFPPLSSASLISGTRVIRSATVTSSTTGGDQHVATLDQDRRVVYASLAADGTVIQPLTVIENSDLGTTAGNPEIALGSSGNTERVFVAWTAGEESYSSIMDTRWAIRDLPNGNWTPLLGFEIPASRLSAGFDPATETWLLTHLSTTGEPLVSVIDFDGTVLLEGAPLGVTAYDFGSPVCGLGDASCTMSYSSSLLGGPSLARIDFDVGVNPVGVIVQSTGVFTGRDTDGRTTLAPSVSDRFRGIQGPRRFELEVDVLGGLDPPVPPSFAIEDWPVGLGAHLDGGGSLTHRLVAPITLECGNGVAQDGEDCDDGNDLDTDDCIACVAATCSDGFVWAGVEDCDDGNLNNGDGCDDMCMDETMGTTSGGAELPGEGCQCEVDERGRFGAGLLALLTIVMLSPRRES